jgi:hypothetical protein
MRRHLFVLSGLALTLPSAPALPPAPVSSVTANVATMSLESCNCKVRTGTTTLTLKGGDAKVQLAAELDLPDRPGNSIRVSISDADLEAGQTKIFHLSATLPSCVVPRPESSWCKRARTP